MIDIESLELESPKRRPLRAFAFDPSRGRMLGNEMQIDVRYRDLGPGPVELSEARDRIAVVDYDATRHRYYRPVDLNHPFVLIPGGIAPSESDPRFHQQMVYAIASDTIEQFENALGRRIHWRRAERPLDAPKGWMADDIVTLTLYPHAMHQANAYYCPEAHGVMFGYFHAMQCGATSTRAGQTVFTCLSHDIIVHELTHAILDGLRGHFMEQTNPDVAAFHEAFADLAALFRHFSRHEVLADAAMRTGGRLYAPMLEGMALADRAAQSFLTEGDQQENPLIALAGQFGEAMGLRSGLRSAIGKRKTTKELRDTTECHERGSVLVAAVFDAFFTVYMKRAEPLVAIYRAGGGHESGSALPPQLVEALCDVATRTAADFFRTCARALYYMPPVDITFGDFLRAVMTAETDYDWVDREGVRTAWMDAFRERGIVPDDIQFYSEDALRWPCWTDRIAIAGLPFGGPLGLNEQERQQTARVLAEFIKSPRTMEILHLDPTLDFSIQSFHPIYRSNRDGSMRWDLIVEIIQTKSSTRTTYPQKGGTTLIVSTHSTAGGSASHHAFVRYAIARPLGGDGGRQRYARQEAYLKLLGYKFGGESHQLRMNFALVHGGT